MKNVLGLVAALALVACTTDDVTFTLPDVRLDASAKDATTLDARAGDAKGDGSDQVPDGASDGAGDSGIDATTAGDADVSVRQPDSAPGGDAVASDATEAVDTGANSDSGQSDDVSANNDGRTSDDGALRGDVSSNGDAGTVVDSGRTVIDVSAGGPIFDPCSPDPQLGFDPLSSGLTACCAGVAPAHCVMKTEVIDLLANQLAACADTTAVCMPDAIIRAGGSYRTPACTSSLTGSSGACISRCIPLILNNPQASFLRQDDCEDGDLCVPCTNPLNGTSTGACELESLFCPAGPVTSEGGSESAVDASDASLELARDAAADANDAAASVVVDATPESGMTDASLACPYVGPPLIDPAIFPGCSPLCGGAHCVPQAVLPGDAASLLATCPSTGGAPGVCAPDVFIASAGNALPPSCEAFAGTTAPGRCLSTCLPAVAAQASLEQATCAADMKCVPCNDPFTGPASGACSIACDQPPATPFTFAACCPSAAGFDGRCVPRSQIADNQEANLLPGTCSNAASLCVPNELLQGSAPATCTATLAPFITYTGTCLSSCLNLGVAAALPRGDCAANHVCFPCAPGLGTPGCP